MSGELRKSVAETWRIPTVDAERCVHGRIEQGSCRACVTACPTDAWIIDDEQLGIVPERCDGCALCGAACPEAAIDIEMNLSLRAWNGRKMLLLGCNRCETTLPDEATIPCLHALGLTALLALYGQGCRHIFALKGECHACSRQGELDIATTLHNINRMLQSRILPPLQFRHVNIPVWKRVWFTSHVEQESRTMDRRHFLRAALAEAVEHGLEKQGGDLPRRQSLATVMEAIPENNPKTDIYPYVPKIDPASCSGCNACIRGCPQDALQLVDDDEGVRYTITPAHCTGCGICGDVCPENAIEIASWTTCTQRSVALVASSCRRCGVPINKPDTEGQDHELCIICATHNHHRNLYQVLE